jgi:hypothetical protein
MKAGNNPALAPSVLHARSNFVHVDSAMEVEVQSKLSPKLLNLLSMFCDKKKLQEQLTEYKIDASRAPLGKLSSKQIRQGYELLERIEFYLKQSRCVQCAQGSGGGGGCSLSQESFACWKGRLEGLIGRADSLCACVWCGRKRCTLHARNQIYSASPDFTFLLECCFVSLRFPSLSFAFLHFPSLSSAFLRFPSLSFAFLRFPSLSFTFLRFPSLRSSLARSRFLFPSLSFSPPLPSSSLPPPPPPQRTS